MRLFILLMAFFSFAYSEFIQYETFVSAYDGGNAYGCEGSCSTKCNTLYPVGDSYGDGVIASSGWGFRDNNDVYCVTNVTFDDGCESHDDDGFCSDDNICTQRENIEIPDACVCPDDTVKSPMVGLGYSTELEDSFPLFECVPNDENQTDDNSTSPGGDDNSTDPNTDDNSTDPNTDDNNTDPNTDDNSTNSGGGSGDTNSTDNGEDSGNSGDINSTDTNNTNPNGGDSNSTDDTNDENNSSGDTNSTDENGTLDWDQDTLDEEAEKFNDEGKTMIEDFMSDKLDTYFSLHHVTVPNFISEKGCVCEEFTIDVQTPLGNINETSNICPKLSEVMKEAGNVVLIIAYLTGLIASIKLLA